MATIMLIQAIGDTNAPNIDRGLKYKRIKNSAEMIKEKKDGEEAPEEGKAEEGKPPAEEKSQEKPKE